MIAELLLERETLDGNEVEGIIRDGRLPDDVRGPATGTPPKPASEAAEGGKERAKKPFAPPFTTAPDADASPA